MTFGGDGEGAYIQVAHDQAESHENRISSHDNIDEEEKPRVVTVTHSCLGRRLQHGEGKSGGWEGREGGAHAIGILNRPNTSAMVFRCVGCLQYTQTQKKSKGYISDPEPKTKWLTASMAAIVNMIVQA